MEKETKWSIDQAHTEISFKLRHLMIAHVKGAFKTFDASIYTSDKDFTTVEIDLWIDASSIYTGDEKRDEHLRSVDFLDVKNYKQITFVSSSLSKPDLGENYELWGALTMIGITKNIKLEVQFGGIQNDPWGNEKAGFTVTGKINRNDWGLKWNTAMETGGLMVGEEVTISCEVELINMSKKDSVMELDSKEDKKTVL
ncbi:MAG TPA: YceI family protein [Cytophagaceae bacterium]|jgi:polyisoprenoid-binding protein YceI|nr:YceI family protein [Cytophagaceae bacterium]